MTRKLRSDFEKKLAKNIKHNPKDFWRYSNTRLRTKAKLDDLKDSAGMIVSNDSRKAQLLNSFFSSVFTEENIENIPEPTAQFAGIPIETIPITTEAVRRKLETVKTDSAPGPDGLHPKLLQLAAEPLASPLASLFRESLDQRIVSEL